MIKLCLMASHNPPGLVFHQEQGISRIIKDSQPCLPCQGVKQEIVRSDCLNLSHQRAYQFEEPWKLSAFCESKQLVKMDSIFTRPRPVDVQETLPDSVHFSYRIAQQCARHEKIMQFLMSRSGESEGGVLDLSMLSELMGLQVLRFDPNQQPLSPSLVHPNDVIGTQNPILDFFGDLAPSSKVIIHPDGRVLFMGNGTEMNHILSVVAEFYLSNKSTKWTRQSMLIPYFDRLDKIEAQTNTIESSLKFDAVTVAPLKSPEKIKVKPSPKKNSKKIGRERDLYKRNYFYACESLLSLLINKRQNGKTAFLSLKKSGPELPELLTQFSAGIAGTGLAVIFSVMCKVACGGVPFCAYKLLSTGCAFGLVWLSWAVYKLRDTVVYINKNASKVDLEQEMMQRVDENVKDIHFRAATLMAVATLRFA